jgi:peptide deformylase
MYSMAVRPVVKAGNLAAKRAAPVEDFENPELKILVQDLCDTMVAAHGVAIAAPQIGVDLQVIVVGNSRSRRYPEKEGLPLIAIMNPDIEAIDATPETDFEGCLSVSGRQGKVPRYKTVLCTGFDIEGNPLVLEATGFRARALQHACDILNGVLFTSYVKKDELLPLREGEIVGDPSRSEVRKKTNSGEAPKP